MDHPRHHSPRTGSSTRQVTDPPALPKETGAAVSNGRRARANRRRTTSDQQRADDPLNAAPVSNRDYPLLTVQSGTDRARFLRLHIIGPRGQSAAFRAWESAAGIGHIRTVGWPGQDPGQHRPKHQPCGTDRQLPPAHHGRAANRRGVPWVFSPDPGLVYEREACNPRPHPRSYTEPVARSQAAKPDEPGNQQWDRKSQRCDSCQNYGDPDRLRICAPPLDPEADVSPGVRLGGDVKVVASSDSPCHHPQHR